MSAKKRELIERLRGNTNDFLVLCLLFLLFCSVFIVNYYSSYRRSGDTAIFAQAINNIAISGKANSNIFANTQDYIDRSIGAKPFDERLTIGEYSLPPDNQSRDMLKFHAYYILVLFAPLCKILDPYTVITLIQSGTLVGCLLIIWLWMRRENKLPQLVFLSAAWAIIAHPGFRIAGVDGSFYPDRIFMFTGMLMTYSLEKKHFSRCLYIIALILCVLTGERAALFAGMFVLAYTFFYRKERSSYCWFRIVSALTSIGLSICLMKGFLDNQFYEGVGKGLIVGFIDYLMVEDNIRKVILFLLINLSCFAIVCIFDIRAGVIGFCSMIPNLIYNVGGAEKTGWVLHYHVYYFVFVIWALCRGVIACYKKMGSSRARNGQMITCTICVLISIFLLMLNPSDTSISIYKNGIASNMLTVIADRMVSVFQTNGSKDVRSRFDKFMAENVGGGKRVSAIEQAMIWTLDDETYLYPMGIRQAEYVVCSYCINGEEYYYTGATSYISSDDETLLNRGLQDILRENGYDVDSPALFEEYKIAVLKR